jgi:hypothetical protein
MPSRDYHAVHAEKQNAAVRAYYAANREAQLQRKRIYNAANAEQVASRRRTKYQTDPEYRARILASNQRSRLKAKESR